MAKSDAMDVVKKNAVSIAAGVVALVALAAIFFYVDPQFEDLQAKVTSSANTDKEIRGQISKRREVQSIDREGGRGDGLTLAGFPTRALVADARKMMADIDGQADGVLAEANRVSRRLPLLFQPEGPFADQDAYVAAFEDAFERAAEAWPLMGESAASQRDLWLREYRRVINADGSFNDDTGDYPDGTLQASLNATRPPTSESMEIAQDIQARRIEAAEPKDQDGNVLDPTGLETRLQEARQSLARSLKNRRALRHRMYIDESDDSGGLSIHPVAESEDPTAADVFEAQVQLWVQQEVLAAIARANEIVLRGEPSGGQNVLNAPVKHLVHLNVPEEFITDGPLAQPDEAPAGGVPGGPGSIPGAPFGGMPPGFGFGEFGGYPGGGFPGGPGGPGGLPDPSAPPAPSGGSSGGSDSGGDSPPAVSDDGISIGGKQVRPGTTNEPDIELTEIPVNPAAQIEPEPLYSPSARKLHTPFYDIVQFNLRMRVAAADLPLVLQQLQTDNFVTVLNVYEMVPIDPLVALREGYIFGNDPVVEVALQCEMVFLREWLEKFMPEETRVELEPWGSD